MHLIKTKRHIAIVLSIFCAFTSLAQNSLFFTPNRGQWDERIRYQMMIPGGYFYLEDQSLTYFFLQREHKHPDEHIESINCHAFKTKFVNANVGVNFTESRKTSFYSNYFVSSDSEKWKSLVYSYYEIRYNNLYPGIDFRIGENHGELKSDYIIKPNADPSKIILEITGADKIKIENEKLVIKTSLSDVIEEKPFAYQIINGIKHEVKCSFVLTNNQLKFNLGAYNRSYELIIDPVLYFSTYIGATADNFGCTATYDKNKHVFGGALVYSPGLYPTTVGAYQTTFAGSSSYRDIGITKFDSTGTYLHYSTYLGGANGTEVPHSLVCDNNGDLYVLGTTGSSDFPTLASAFDNTFNGGPAVSAPSQGLNYPTGTDIVVVKFNSTGTALLGSTFLGGTNNDGVNNSLLLNYNYGDFIRGEIILDNSGNPIVCSNTFSTNYPVSLTAPQTVSGGQCDAVVTKLNTNLTGIIWSTYYGGSGDDAGYGMQPDLAGNLFFTGGTSSTNLFVTAGVYDNSANGGVDGFLAKINSAGTTFMASTYLGTPAYDQSYLVQVDLSNYVYVFGQTTGAYPQSVGVYNNGSGGQFIHKFDNTLNSSIWSTRIGTGSGEVDISPTAFLVNNCYKIFICGWGGDVNHYGLADFSTTFGLPTTTSGFQLTTDGSDFYLAIFSEDMAGLEYGTFFGGPVSHEHVDGGTARFDKDGVVYQAVCAGCGSNDDFPTTAGAWSNTNNSSNCNLAVFKFNLESVISNFNYTSVSPMCTLPYTFNFSNSSTYTSSFFWDFGDGTTSTAINPSHTYGIPGDYLVTLVAMDTTPCNNTDTFTLTVHVPDPISLNQPTDTILCLGQNYPVDLGEPGTTFTWTPSSFVSDPSLGNVIITPTSSTNYTVVSVNTDGCSDTVNFEVQVIQPPNASFTILSDSCVLPVSLSIFNLSTGTTNYFWNFGDGFTSTSAVPVHDYSLPGNYMITLTVTDTGSCGFTDADTEFVFVPPLVNLNVTGDSLICLGTSGNLFASGADNYTWTPSGSLSDATISNPLANPTATTEYTVIGESIYGCKDTVSFTVNVIQQPIADFDAIFTPCIIPATVSLNNTSSNAQQYIWLLDGQTISATDLNYIFTSPGTYTITLIAIDTSFCGFTDTTTTTIFLPPPAVAQAFGTDTVCSQTPTPVYATGGETYQWIPANLFSNPNSASTIVTPNETVNAIVIVTDSNSCVDTAMVTIYVFPVPYIDAGVDLIYDFGDGPHFNPTFPPGGTFYWTPSNGLSCTNCVNPEATPEETTTYYLIYTDVYGCTYYDSLTVFVTPTIYIPNAFTPNGDGINDVFLPIVRNLDYYKIEIFDRWGELIFSTEDKNRFWDGLHKNIKAKEDVYVWKLTYTTDLEPYSNREKTGHVTLLR